jgi:hypothetical protein
MILIATLTVRRAAAEEFRRFEREAARIMERHGGAIERVIALRHAGDSELYRELHVVRFPSDEAFAAYRQDPELVGLGVLRDFAIAKTEILFGDEAPGYHAPG